MFLKRIFYVVLCLSIALSGWAISSSKNNNFSLSIGRNVAHKIDPSLQVFIQQVWAGSPVILGAQAAIEGAKAHLGGANKALHNPTLEIDAERTNINTTSIGFSQTIDWSDKRAAFIRIAERELQVAEAGFQDARQRIAVETLESLVRYFTAHEMQTLTRQRSQLMKAFIDTVQHRQAAGDVAPLDVMLAQVAYSEALMQQATSESNLAETEAMLQAVSGLTTIDWPSLPTVLAFPPKRADAVLLESLPQLTLLRSRMEAARARIKLAEREGGIDPTIGFRAGREDSDTLLGLSIEIPLFVRNNFKAEAVAASHDAMVEEQAYRDGYRRARAQLNGAWGRFETTRRAWHAWVTSGQQSQRQQMSLLELMWQQGELSSTDFLIQAKQNIDTQTAATALMGETWQSAIAWLSTSGQIEQWLGLEKPAIKINFGE